MVKTYGPDKLTIEQVHSKRADAIAAGHSHYFTGKPCKHGHVEIRETKYGACLECLRAYYQKNRKKKITLRKRLCKGE